MNARIATDERSVMHCEPVRIARISLKIHRLQHSPSGRIVLDERRPELGMALAIVTDDLPDAAVVPGDGVIAGLVGSLVERNHKFRLPGVRIETQNGAQPQ